MYVCMYFATSSFTYVYDHQVNKEIIYIYIYIYLCGNHFDILTKACKYILPFLSCDVLQSSFEISNQNFAGIPETK